ncbi:MAG: hypothetical protein QOI73_1981 [Solirubrobacteraceae bacterium]|nr:hypothetical protein [Solirubrobacteraceae bacterium]
MSNARRSRRLTGAAVAALALLAPATAAADGLPLPVEESPSGVLAPDGSTRYLGVTLNGDTAILAQRARDGAVLSRKNLRGRYGIPLVAYDSSAGGISGDGRRLVLIRPRTGFPRRETTFAVLTTKPMLRLRRTIRLRGDFSYDALSADGRTLFLINYLSRTDQTKYRVRVYDLVRDRLDPKPVTDPREPPDEMNGLPVTRVSSPDGRWAYTLYDRNGEQPFIHALDTRERRAFCIDLHDPAFGHGAVYDLRLAVAAGGRRLDVTRKGKTAASVSTATFRVSAPAPAAAATGDPPGPSPLWPALGLALVACLLAVWRFGRHRGGHAVVTLRGREAP